MKRLNHLLLAVLTTGVAMADPAAEGPVTSLHDSLIRMSVDRVDLVTTWMARSARVLGREYASALENRPGVSAEERAASPYLTDQGITTFQTWPGDVNDPPAYQAPFPAFHDYSRQRVTDGTIRQFRALEALVPAFRAEYETFGFSWVYFTTREGAMMIYPFLPARNALENAPPTEQIFYTSADFAGRRCGWTPPYLDLAGAGMMVTVACPVYAGGVLLGVMSRDITLEQLSGNVLQHLAVEPGAIACVVDGEGLVLGSSDPALAAELEEVNEGAGAAVLHYRSEAGLKTLGREDAVASSSMKLNAVTEALLESARSAEGDVIRVDREDSTVLAGRTPGTGWYVVLMLPAGPD